MRIPVLAGTAILMLASPAFAVPSRTQEQPLTSVVNPPRTIANANVRDASGQIIGAVQRVDLTSQGRPSKVAVALLKDSERIVVLDAGELSYNAGQNEITDPARADTVE